MWGIWDGCGGEGTHIWQRDEGLHLLLMLVSVAMEES